LISWKTGDQREHLEGAGVIDPQRRERAYEERQQCPYSAYEMLPVNKNSSLATMPAVGTTTSGVSRGVQPSTLAGRKSNTLSKLI
jgi:hypothetical protein